MQRVSCGNVVDRTAHQLIGSRDLSSLEEQFSEKAGPIGPEDRNVLEDHVVEWQDVFLGGQEIAELESEKASVQRQCRKVEEVALPPRSRDRERERFRGLLEPAGHSQRERSRDEIQEFVGLVERTAAGKCSLGEIDRLSSREAAPGLLGCRGREQHPRPDPPGELLWLNEGEAVGDDRIELWLELSSGDQPRLDTPVEITVQVANSVTRAPHKLE